jgi:hypothetical protein
VTPFGTLFDAFSRSGASFWPSVIPSGLRESRPRVSSPLFSCSWSHPAAVQSVFALFPIHLAH